MNGVSIVIPNWNGADKLVDTIEALLWNLKELSYPFEIIVVDDASTDNSREILRVFDNITIEYNNTNQGFSKTANKGVQLAGYDLVFIMSNDIVIGDSFESLIAHFNDPSVFAVSPQVMWSDGRFAYGKRSVMWHHGYFKVREHSEYTYPVHTLFACGGSGMFRRNVFLELGGFDDMYSPFYWEEIDLCYRAWKRGYTVIHDPRAVVCNNSAGVIKKHFSPRYIKHISGRNSYLFLWKNITSPNLIREHVRCLLPSLLKEIFACRFRFPMCFFAALEYLPQVLFMRRQEKRHAGLSDNEVIARVNNDTPVYQELETRKLERVTQ